MINLAVYWYLSLYCWSFLIAISHSDHLRG